MGQTELTFENGQFVLHGFRAGDANDWTPTGARAQSTYRLKAAAAFRQYADSKARKVFNRAFNETYLTPHLPRLTFLDPHQRAGVEWILTHKRCYLAHAPGAGKTATALTAAWLSESGTNIIVVPPGLTLNWAKEIDKFWPEFSFTRPTISIVNTENEQRGLVKWSANFLIVPDSMLSKPWVYSGLTKTVINLLVVDEASRLKEITSERSIAFYGGLVRGKDFRGLFKNARHVVLLDGSPMPNGRPMELWAPVYALDPEVIACMGRHQFGEHYCEAYEDRFGHWNYNGSSRPKEFSERLRESFMHVVTEDELSHPERRRSLLFIDYDVRTAKHKSWERANLKTLDVEKLSENASQGDFARWRRQLGTRKVPWSAEYISRRLKDKGESILVFVWHRDVATELQSALRKLKVESALVLGGTNPIAREKIFELFQAGKLKIIIGNIQAMGRGYNLQRADRVVFVEWSWSDELNKQCEKRASRKGSARKFIRSEYIVAPESMEERVLSSVFTKQKRVRSMIG